MEARKALAISRDAFTVIYVGHLEERKAVPIPDPYKERIRSFEGDALSE